MHSRNTSMGFSSAQSLNCKLNMSRELSNLVTDVVCKEPECQAAALPTGLCPSHALTSLAKLRKLSRMNARVPYRSNRLWGKRQDASSTVQHIVEKHGGEPRSKTCKAMHCPCPLTLEEWDKAKTVGLSNAPRGFVEPWYGRI